jgi:hypothetical protein
MSEEQQNKPVTITFPDGRTASNIVNLVVKKKPAGWSRRSYATYYKKRYAEWLKRDIDAMMIDRQPVIYRKDLWPNVSMHSLYLRVNQALRYLLDPENNMDPDGKYKKFMEEIHIGFVPKGKSSKIGVAMMFDEVLEGNEPKAEKFVGEEDMPKWKMELDEWLESGSNTEPFHRSGLILTPEVIEQLKLELDGLENVIASITSRDIKIIKA